MICRLVCCILLNASPKEDYSTWKIFYSGNVLIQVIFFIICLIFLICFLIFDFIFNFAESISCETEQVPFISLSTLNARNWDPFQKVFDTSFHLILERYQHQRKWRRDNDRYHIKYHLLKEKLNRYHLFLFQLWMQGIEDIYHINTSTNGSGDAITIPLGWYL